MSTQEGLKPPELYDVVASVGNNEMQAITLASMRSGESFSAWKLHEQAMSLQGEPPIWLQAKLTPFGYCDTFASVGLVAETTIGLNATFAYRISERGRRLALPLLGHLLDVTMLVEPSLLDFFGPTQTNSKGGIRPSERRIRIMDIVRRNEGKEMRLSDLGRAVCLRAYEASSITDDLEAGAVISKQSSGRGKPSVTYLAKPALTEINLRHDIGTPLLFAVVEALQKQFIKNPNAAISNSEITELLMETTEFDLPRSQLLRKVAGITNRLSDKRGVLEAKRTIEGDNTRELIWATSEQVEMISNVMEAVEGIQRPSQAYLVEGREKIETIVTDPDSVDHLVAKAKEDSLGLKRLPDERLIIQTKVAEIISQSVIPLSLRELRKILLEGGDNLDKLTIKKHLDELIELGKTALGETTEGFKYSPIH